MMGYRTPSLQKVEDILLPENSACPVVSGYCLYFSTMFPGPCRWFVAGPTEKKRRGTY